jgi:hypothetical protein
VLILKEACDVRLVPVSHDSSKLPAMPYNSQSMNSTISCSCIPPGKKLTFSWKIDNFLAFKEILETRKIFSKYLSIGGCDLRIGVYESFDTLCIYLESESQAQPAAQDASFWVQYRIAAVSQKVPHLTEWQESSICTRSWSNSVLQFIKVPDMLNRCCSPTQADDCWDDLLSNDGCASCFTALRSQAARPRLVNFLGMPQLVDADVIPVSWGHRPIQSRQEGQQAPCAVQ